MYIYTYMYKCICIYVYVYTYNTHAHTHTHTHTHTYTYTHIPGVEKRECEEGAQHDSCVYAVGSAGIKGGPIFFYWV